MSGDRAWRGDGGLVEQRRGKCAVRGRQIPSVGKPQISERPPGTAGKDENCKAASGRKYTVCQSGYIRHFDETEPLRSNRLKSPPHRYYPALSHLALLAGPSAPLRRQTILQFRATKSSRAPPQTSTPLSHLPPNKNSAKMSYNIAGMAIKVGPGRQAVPGAPALAESSQFAGLLLYRWMIWSWNGADLA